METTGIVTIGIHRSGWLVLGMAEKRETGVSMPGVLVKTSPEDGRRVITSLVFHRRVSSAVTNQFRTGWLESMINTPRLSTLLAACDGKPDLLTKAIERIAFAQDVEQYEGEPAREPLTRPDGTDPDVFYRRVAEAYRSAIHRRHAPALAIAEEATVPVGTARRWIAEARRRGHLGSAGRGKAGEGT